MSEWTIQRSLKKRDGTRRTNDSHGSIVVSVASLLNDCDNDNIILWKNISDIN